MISNPIYGKIKNVNQTTNQTLIIKKIPVASEPIPPVSVASALESSPGPPVANGVDGVTSRSPYEGVTLR